jgi:hypothetical protein
MPEPTTPKFVFNETVVKAKFADIEKSVNATIGKKGFNPYLWMEKLGINKLAERFGKNKERTEELYKAILALPSVVPKVLSDEPTPPKAVVPPALVQGTGVQQPPA